MYNILYERQMLRVQISRQNFQRQGKVIHIYSIFSISMCAVVYKKQAGMQVQLSGIQQYDILNRSVARILSGCLFGD